MATTRQVQQALKKFNTAIDRANRDVLDILETIRELEEALEKFDEDEDVNVTRGLKADVRRGKKEIDELRKSVDKLDRELSDTNRKFHNLAR